MNDNTGSVRDILTVLFKHKQKIIITFFAVVAAVTIGTFLISPTYEAKSSLLVKFGREYLYTPEVGEGRPTLMASGQEELLNSEVQILMNHDIIGKVLASLGIQNVYPGLSAFSGIAKSDAAINQFKRSLIVEPVKKSNVIQVSFQHHNPESAPGRSTSWSISSGRSTCRYTQTPSPPSLPSSYRGTGRSSPRQKASLRGSSRDTGSTRSTSKGACS